MNSHSSTHRRFGAFAVTALLTALATPAHALDRPETPYKIFQFPPDQIPRIDGKTDDWAIVPDSYIVGTDQLGSDVANSPRNKPNPASIDVKVRIGWVKGLNRLYFLYEATDNYWDFTRPDVNQDIFELAVDGDLSGGPFAEKFRNNPESISSPEYLTAMQSVQAQNYHIFTPPAEGKDWCLGWGATQWTKEFPYANHASAFNFKPGQGGKFIIEFWITPFDYASIDGPARSVESDLRENKLVGMSWAILDYDDARSTMKGFWNLSNEHNMWGNATLLNAFKLMPLEPILQKKLDAKWSFKILDKDRRMVGFVDESVGKVTAWKWEFGDGTTSSEQNPLHTYKDGGQYIVTLNVAGPDGQAKLIKVWDVTLK